MKYNLVLVCVSIAFLFSCGTKNNDTSIPDPHAIENLSEASLNVLNEAIEDDPSNDVLFYKRALFYHRLKNYPKALSDIKQALELDQDKGDYYLLLGETQYALGNIIAARNAATKAETMLDNIPALKVLQSNIYLDLKDSLQYEKYIRQTIQLIPFKADADYVLAKKALLDKDSSLALSYLMSSVKKDRDFLPAYKEIIRFYLNKGMYDSSMSYVLNGIRISHLDPLFYEAEGRFFEKMKLYGAAESAYLIAYNYSNKNPQYYKLLGDLKYKTGDYSKALSWYNLMLNARPQDQELLKLCGETSLKAREWDKSVKYYARLVDMDSTNRFYNTQYLFALKNQGDQDFDKISEPKEEVKPKPIVSSPVRAKKDSTTNPVRRVVKPKSDSTAVSTPINRAAPKPKSDSTASN